MTDQPITVVTVDDHPLIREAVRGILAPLPHITLIGEGAEGAAVLPLLEEKQPDVLLLDLGMPQSAADPDGGRFAVLPLLAQLGRMGVETAVIILTNIASPVVMQEAFRLGVRGYLLKNDLISLDVAGAIEAVQRGGVYFSPACSAVLFGDQQHPEPEIKLTRRQKEVILSIARRPDTTYAALAQRLCITENTIKRHLTDIFRKLEVNNITACVIACMRYRLIPFAFDDQGRLEFGRLEGETVVFDGI